MLGLRGFRNDSVADCFRFHLVKRGILEDLTEMTNPLVTQGQDVSSVLFLRVKMERERAVVVVGRGSCRRVLHRRERKGPLDSWGRNIGIFVVRRLHQNHIHFVHLKKVGQG